MKYFWEFNLNLSVPLFILFSIAFFLLMHMGKLKETGKIAYGFSFLALVFGMYDGLHIADLFYPVLYLTMGFFPVPLRKEIETAKERYDAGILIWEDEVSKSRLLREKWSEIFSDLSGGMNQIIKRYEFAKTLAAHIDEKPVLADLGGIFSQHKMVTGFVFCTFSTDAESTKNCPWIPVSVHGWVPEESWKKILKDISYPVEELSSRTLVQDPAISLPRKKDFLSLVYAPVKWEGRVQGLLAFLLEDEVPRSAFEEISVYAQLLGLGLHKALLYKVVAERSRRDGLTNLYLRRIFLERLNEEIIFSKRYGTSFSVLMLDLDYFKSVNDTYGHLVGDSVLKSVAESLTSTLHPGVTISRYGGEEFSVLIGLAPQNEVLQMAESIRSAVEKIHLPLSDFQGILSGGKKRKGDTDSIRVTVSIGAAHYLPDTPSAEELIKRSDSALYHAKESGRNCVREWKP